ncbi:hypothetical protein MKK67_11640 [Methylobacterium sp. J-072]|uniref:hypothetical protein n=1 Tax=Methylobacterium sp. J-072 TaxID=2836651 RepID=UPI001FBB6724|nr:hypothetical protein [Methylobacterium sp. J-072]MCJ2093144.1 hypothetical protein [Methylobacterium sp. J-072]
MNAPRLLRGAARVVSGLASLAALIVFIIAALDDHTATATAAAGLCLALAVLAALDLESFEGLGIKAKLRTTLSDAEARLNGLDALIRSLARSAFVQAGRGALAPIERRDLVTDLTASLVAAGMTPDAIEAFKRPVYSYIAGGLWYPATTVRASYLSKRLKELELRQRQVSGDEWHTIQIERDRLNSVEVTEHPYNDSFERFRAIAERMAVETPVTSSEDRQTLVTLMAEISDLFDECRSTGNLTDRAMAAMSHGHALGNPFVEAMMTRFR